MMVRSTGKHGLWLWMLIARLNAAAAQGDEGFLSIDCGATEPSTDSITGFEWVTDDPYISTGTKQVLNNLAGSYQSKKQLQTLRYFPADRSKHCYILPASRNSSYLLRARFLHGGFQPLTENWFDLSIDSTIVDRFLLGSDDDLETPFFYEYMIFAMSEQITFCLLPRDGNPYINTLELRPLAAGMYDVVFNGKYLSTLSRYNFGVADSIVRYPDDAYDRFWFVPDENPNVNSTKTTSDIEVPVDDAFDRPPMAVMQTAWVSSDSITWGESISDYELERSTTFYVSLFFAEVEELSPTDTRIIDIALNGLNIGRNFTIPSSTIQIYDKKRTLSSSGINFTLTANPVSTLGPLLNAAELYAWRDAITFSTDERDVDALEAVKSHFNLSSWTGDPCLPKAYNWLSCDQGSTPRVTNITLSGSNLVGTIPPSIASLTALTELLLDDNKISGSIPDLSNLTKLASLHLQNNILSGPIPSTLASLPVLKELFLSNNNLSGPIPVALANRAGLNLQTSGNDKLCPPTSNCPIFPSEDDGKSGDGDKGDNGGGSGALIGGIVGGVLGAGLAIAAAISIYCYCRRQAGHNHAPLPIDQKARQKDHAREFTLAEVQEATDGYKTKIGEGGFGPVYYGKLSDGTELAVKVNSGTSVQGTTEFKNEVSVLSRAHHRNLVSLLGYCQERGQRILIYEYMPSGTLRQRLYGKQMKGKISWKIRLDIAFNAAKGLEYLHNHCHPKIIHRDVKTSNILLNGKLEAKVADFGIAKLAPEDGETAGVITKIRGTTGYLDPEYYHKNRLTRKSDVYSFGVVLLEIICGRPPRSPDVDDISQNNLIDWARSQLNRNDLESIVDPEIRGTYKVEAMWKVAELAMVCVQPLGANRPDMSHVVRNLNEVWEMEEVKTQMYTAGENVLGGGYNATPVEYSSNFRHDSFINSSTQDSADHSIPDIRTGSSHRGANISGLRISSGTRAPESSWFTPQPR